MQIQYMRFFKNTRIALVMILTLIGVGCVSHPSYQMKREEKHLRYIQHQLH